MKLFENTLCVILSFLIVTAPAAAQQDPGFVFRYKPKVLLVDGAANPVDPEDGDNSDEDGEDSVDPEDGSLQFANSIRTVVYADRSYEDVLEAVGGTGDYVFSAENLPDFVELTEQGGVTIEPTLDDLGDHPGIVLTVSDGASSVQSLPIRMQVRVPSETVPTPMASAAYLDGVEVSRHLTYNDNVEDFVVLAGVGSTLEYVYDTPVESFGAYLYTNRAVDLEAFVEGDWVTLRTASGKRDAYSSDFTRYASDRWRLRNRGASGTRVRAFRPAFADAHDVPAFLPSSGYLGPKGTVARIEANRFSSRYAHGPVVLDFAPGTVVPAGVELHSDGALSVSESADFATEWHFTIIATDSVGFQSAKDFYVTAEAMQASQLMAYDFTVGSDAVDYRRMYDGGQLAPSIPATVTQTRPLVVDFKAPVEADSAFLGLSGSIDRVTIEYEVDGEWLPIITTARRSEPVSFGRTVVASRFRLLSANTRTPSVTEFRVGGGPEHAWPQFMGSQHLPALSAINGSTRIEGIDASTYRNALNDPSYEVMDGVLPSFLTLLPDGTFEVGEAQAEDGEWSFTARITDAEGFYADRDYHIANSSVEAAGIMASAVDRNGASIDKSILYDGLSDRFVALNSASPVIVDLGEPALFDRAYISKTSGTLIFEAELDGQWQEIGRTSSASHEDDFAFDGAFVAQRVRISKTGSGNFRMSEFRLGGGPAHSAPMITYDGQPISVQAESRTINLTGSSSREHYFPDNGLRWQVDGGSLPGTATLSPDGVLSLPSFAEVTGSAWEATIRATDKAGFVATMDYRFINADAVPASGAYPVSIARGSVQAIMNGEATVDDHIAITSSSPLIIDYGRLVRFDSVLYSLTSYAVAVDIETSPNVWQHLGDISTSSSISSSSFGATYTTQRIRLRRTGSIGTANLREFRLGSGPAHPYPSMAIADLAGTVGASAQSIDLRPTWGTVYSAGRPTYSIIDGFLPDGASINRDGMLALPAIEHFEGGHGTWAFTVRMEDGVGAYSDRELFVSSLAPSAASYLPVSAYLGNVEVDRDRLYDGLEATADKLAVTSSSPLMVEFDQPVSVASVYTSINSPSMPIEVETVDGRWLELNKTWNNSTGVISFDRGWVSKRFRIRYTAGTSIGIGDSRFGNGPVHFKPRPAESQIEAFLVANSGSVSRTLTAQRSPYASTLTWSIAEASSQEGITLTPEGVITASRGSGEPRVEYVKARITDDLGSWEEAHYLVGIGVSVSASNRASSVVPVSIARGTVQVDLPVLYDDNTTTSINLSPNQDVVIEFDRVVQANSLRVHLARVSGTGARTADIEFEAGGKWFKATDFSRNVSPTSTVTGNIDFGRVIYAKRFRVISTHATSSAKTGVLKLGYGTTFPTVN